MPNVSFSGLLIVAVVALLGSLPKIDWCDFL